MSVQSEINRISGNVTAALAAIAEKGVSVPNGSDSDDLATLIASIEAGGSKAKFSYGSFTVAESTSGLNDGYNIEHGLGEMPTSFVVWTSEKMGVVNATHSYHSKYLLTDSFGSKMGYFMRSKWTSTKAIEIAHTNFPTTLNTRGAHTADETNISVYCGSTWFLGVGTYYWAAWVE